ncbi:hypothetical protein [Streptomyces sp. Ru72]|uniref:hypothetical protein n=1 Tax=Streptomyces sp. Ru72 TaxID=2080747 RepID=UPI0026D8D7B9|nr:hypothetical protein [Streptomyces sp. Ru72]
MKAGGFNAASIYFDSGGKADDTAYALQAGLTGSPSMSQKKPDGHDARGPHRPEETT